jgi:hypothetical protein
MFRATVATRTRARRRMSPLKRSLRPLLALALAACASARVAPKEEGTATAGPADPAARLRRDLFVLAADSFRGREAGTLDELRASAWVAERAREAGLEPAGEDGSYFQFWPMRRIRPSTASRAALGGQLLVFGTDAAIVQPANAVIDLPVLFVGEGREADVAGRDLTGKAVAAVLSPPTPLPAADVSLRGFRYTRAAIAERTAFLAERGAALVLLVSDSAAEESWDFIGTQLARGRYGLDTAGAAELPAGPPVIWLRSSLLDRVKERRVRLAATLHAESFVQPSVNVVARAPGRDRAAGGQVVLFSGHQDHDGARFAIDGDSIWNGADDNATVSVALLEIARQWRARPGRRSALFVWHGAEERGLLGSRWFVAHPTVPRDSIVAVLNGDMIGRNHPDSAALLGVQPPHRNSTALVAAALDANARTARFAVDTLWDRPDHPEGWYFRSDHLPYARANIPAIFFTTLLHPDYHTPRDEASRIDIAKLARMTSWMYETGRAVADAPERPGIDQNFKLER